MKNSKVTHARRGVACSDHGAWRADAWTTEGAVFVRVQGPESEEWMVTLTKPDWAGGRFAFESHLLSPALPKACSELIPLIKQSLPPKPELPLVMPVSGTPYVVYRVREGYSEDHLLQARNEGGWFFRDKAYPFDPRTDAPFSNGFPTAQAASAAAKEWWEEVVNTRVDDN